MLYKIHRREGKKYLICMLISYVSPSSQRETNPSSNHPGCLRIKIRTIIKGCWNSSRFLTASTRSVVPDRLSPFWSIFEVRGPQTFAPHRNLTTSSTRYGVAIHKNDMFLPLFHIFKFVSVSTTCKNYINRNDLNFNENPFWLAGFEGNLILNLVRGIKTRKSEPKCQNPPPPSDACQKSAVSKRSPATGGGGQ